MPLQHIVTSGLSAEAHGRLEKALHELGRAATLTSSATSPAVPAADLLVIDAGSLDDLREWRQLGSDVPAVVLASELPLQQHEEDLGIVLLASPEALEAAADVERLLLQMELLARATASVQGQLRVAEEKSFQLQLENEELVRRLEAAEAEEPLTGLRSERAMARSIETAFQLARRHQTPVACLICSIDGFAALSEGSSAPFAEFINEQTAHRIKTCMRHSDLISRYGPGEFLVLSPFATPEGAAALAERMREAAASQRLEYESRTLSLSLTVGVGNYSLEMTSASELVEAAAAALETAREQGAAPSS